MKIRESRARSFAAESELELDDARSFQGFETSKAAVAGKGGVLMDDRHSPSDLGRGNRSINGANGAGKTQLITQNYNDDLGRYDFSGRQDTDAILIGSRYTISNLTFSFPTSGAFYADQGYATGTEPDSQVVFNAQQQTAVRYALNLVSSYTNLTFQEITETADTHANLRLSQTNYSDVVSAYGNFPSSSQQAGDVWFNAGDVQPQPFYATPAVGNWGQATIMHELGHTLGLKHGHQDYTDEDLTGNLDGNVDGSPRAGSVALTRNHDGQDWSLMSYASDPSIDPDYSGFEGEGFNQPQTYMQDDIAALQYLYGANFNTNADNTTYTWNPTTGQMSINGVGQATPTSNKILMTLWDGNGVDTYDLSNYTTNQKIDLRPGEFSTFSTDQLANHEAYSGGTALAEGNIANALQYQRDSRSLIENAKGGTGNDRIIGNQAKNTLTGNDGADTLIGAEGDDTLLGGKGVDTLIGDGVAGAPSGIIMGSGQFTKTAGLGNTAFATAVDLTARFALTENSDIIDSTTIPHVTVSATGDGNVDYYAITVKAGVTVTLDIDHTVGLDNLMTVRDANGKFVAYDDDSSIHEGAGGSVLAPNYYLSSDGFLVFTAKADGVYYIQVGSYSSTAAIGVVDAGAKYQLQVSVSDVPAIGGGKGNDTLDGGEGADIMSGGAGDDLYFVDNANDTVIEKSGEGTDKVGTSVSYTLGAGQFIEKLSTTSASGKTKIDLTGNEFANILSGNDGANVLDGKAGGDIMYGRGGDDLFFVDNIADQVIEATNDGTDKVGTSVSYTLATGQSIEQLSTTSASGTAAINLTGNEIVNRLSGNNGANILDGKGGSDLVYGRGGADIFAFSTTLGAGNVDTIMDFANSTNTIHDTIRLSRAIFTQIGTGATLDAAAFKDITSGGAVDADDRILYNKTTGALFYDADGSGTTSAAVQFATLDNKVALTAADFAIGA